MKTTVTTTELCGFNGRDIKLIYTVILNCINLKADFDYPDYGGLPKSISDKFGPDQVDNLQALCFSLKATELTEDLVFRSLIE